jgi:hypothetical protein
MVSVPRLSLVIVWFAVVRDDASPRAAVLNAFQRHRLGQLTSHADSPKKQVKSRHDLLMAPTIARLRHLGCRAFGRGRSPLFGDISLSHIVEVRTEIRDPIAVCSACRRLGLPEPISGTAQLFEGEASGLLVRLPGWLYPAVVDLPTGKVRYDNYNGSWGDPAQLDRFFQAYSVEKAKVEARKRGHSVTEQTLQDGSIQLTIAVSGGAS